MDLGCGLKVELTHLASKFDVGNERQGEQYYDGCVFGLSNWRNGSAIY